MSNAEADAIDQEVVLRLLSTHAGDVARVLEDTARRRIRRNRERHLYAQFFGVDESEPNPDRVGKLDFLQQLDDALRDHVELLELARSLDGLAMRRSAHLIAEAVRAQRE